MGQSKENESHRIDDDEQKITKDLNHLSFHIDVYNNEDLDSNLNLKNDDE